MLDNFIFSVNVVLPIFVVMFLGFVIRSRKMVDAAILRKINNIVFYIALPIMLFRDISVANFSEIFDLELALFTSVMTVIIFFACWAYAFFFIKSDKSKSAFVQAAFRGNYAIVGLPIVMNVMGAAYSGRAILIITFVVPIYNVLSVCVLCYYNGQKLGGMKFVKQTFIHILKNPIILGIFAGLPFSVFGWALPQVLRTSVQYVGGMGLPLALIVIGGNVDLKSFQSKVRASFTATFAKLVLAPAVFVPIAIAMGITGENLLIIYVVSSTPAAINSYIMAEAMGSDTVLTANIIVLSTFLSVFTFTLGVFIFKTFGLI